MSEATVFALLFSIPVAILWWGLFGNDTMKDHEKKRKLESGLRDAIYVAQHYKAEYDFVLKFLAARGYSEEDVKDYREALKVMDALVESNR